MKQIFQRTLFLILITQASAYEEKKKKKNEEEKKPISGHVFGWPFLKSEKMQPRGGTTKGGDVTLFEGAKESWTCKVLTE